LASAENDFKPKLKGLPIRLYFQDEGRFGRINTVQKCWCQKGKIPSVTQQLVREYTYAFSAVCPETGKVYSLIMPYADSEAMNIFLKELSNSQNNERIILCMDKAGWHTTKQLVIPDNLIVWFLPPYSPELNPVELIWRELRSKYFNNQTFNSLKDVDSHLEFALRDFAKDKESVKKLTKIKYIY
jgi:transposase